MFVCLSEETERVLSFLGRMRAQLRNFFWQPHSPWEDAPFFKVRKRTFVFSARTCFAHLWFPLIYMPSKIGRQHLHLRLVVLTAPGYPLSHLYGALVADLTWTGADE